MYRRTLNRFSTKKRAVNGITLTIPKGECFGLLGVNGKIGVYIYVFTHTDILVEEHIFYCLCDIIDNNSNIGTLNRPLLKQTNRIKSME